MRYFYEKPEHITSMYGRIYICDHPVYNRCTLFEDHDKGLAVIQQRFESNTKKTYWTEIDNGLADILYLSSGFENYFNKHSGFCRNGLYPTVTVRQIMWALKMKPIKKQRWETVFDHGDI